MMKASVFIDGRLVSTGIAHEDKEAGYVNKTSFCEVAETSAVGRALGILGIGISQSVATYDEVRSAIQQQEQMEKNDELREYKAGNLSVSLAQAIEEDDEVGIKEVENDYRGDPKLAELVRDSLNPEQVHYMADRKDRLAEERKAKSAEKEALNKKLAKDFAEKQKAK